VQTTVRVADPEFGLDAFADCRFAAPGLADGKITAAEREADRSLRVLIAATLGRLACPVDGSGAGAPLLVEYRFVDLRSPNAAALDGPSDYRRSWNPAIPPDGTGTGDHTIASAPLGRELRLQLLLIPAVTGRVAWEGSAGRVVALDLEPGTAAWDRTLRGMLRELAARIPRRAAPSRVQGGHSPGG